MSLVALFKLTLGESWKARRGMHGAGGRLFAQLPCYCKALLGWVDFAKTQAILANAMLVGICRHCTRFVGIWLGMLSDDLKLCTGLTPVAIGRASLTRPGRFVSWLQRRLCRAGV